MRSPVFWNPWNRTQRELLARLVLEDLESIERLVKKCSANARPRYGSGDPEWKKVRALYRYLQRQSPQAGGGYNEYKFERRWDPRKGQEIRLAPQVLYWGLGNCLEWTLLLAACIYRESIPPVLLVTHNHVLLGYWIGTRKRSGSVVLTGSVVRRHIAQNRMGVVDAVWIPIDGRKEHTSFSNAQLRAIPHLGGIRFAVDVQAARDTGIEPLKTADPAAYLRRLLDETSHIDVRGLPTGAGEAYRFPIEDLYITLTTPGAASSGGAIPLERRLQEKEKRLVVLGDPGAGKSTFLRRLGRDLCRSVLRHEAPDPALVPLDVARFPLFLETPSELLEFIKTDKSRRKPLSHTAARWVPRFFGKLGDDQIWKLDEDFFHLRLDETDCCLLVDGLDHVSGKDGREHLATLLQNFAGAYPKCAIVVTSRPAAFEGRSVLPGFARARIEPLDDPAVLTFLERWCAALCPGDPAAAKNHYDHLTDELRGNSELRNLARNPLMLTAAAVLYWNQKILPVRRSELYQSILTWLAESRRRRPRRVPPERCIDILQRLAIEMHDHRKGRRLGLTPYEAARAIASHRYFRGSTAKAQAFIEEEEIDSGIIVRRDRRVEFWHPTFQEFLAARALRSDVERRDALFGKRRNVLNPDWRQAVFFLAHLLRDDGVESVDELVKLLLKARAAELLDAVLLELKPLYYEPSPELAAKIDELRSRAVRKMGAQL